METVSKLSQLIGVAFVFVSIALLTTGAVYLGAWALRRQPTRAQFWRLFAVTCLIWLVLMVIGRSLD